MALEQEEKKRHVPCEHGWEWKPFKCCERKVCSKCEKILMGESRPLPRAIPPVEAPGRIIELPDQFEYRIVAVNTGRQVWDYSPGIIPYRPIIYRPKIPYNPIIHRPNRKLLFPDLNRGDARYFSLEQEGFKWRNDDGTEITATDLAAQDANITRWRNVNTRLRMLINATGNPDPAQFRLEYRKKGTSQWDVV